MKADKLVRVSGMSLHEAQRIVANFPVSRLTVRCLFRYTKKKDRVVYGLNIIFLCVHLCILYL